MATCQRSVTCGLLISFALLLSAADHPDVLQFPLPDPGAFGLGVWLNQRRPEILKAFADQVYGRTPTTVIPSTITSINEPALNGTAIRKQITLTFERAGVRHQIHVLLYLPANTKDPVPVIVGLNFAGNQTVSADPGITLQAQAKPEARGAYAYRWQVLKLLAGC